MLEMACGVAKRHVLRASKVQPDPHRGGAGRSRRHKGPEGSIVGWVVWVARVSACRQTGEGAGAEGKEAQPTRATGETRYTGLSMGGTGRAGATGRRQRAPARREGAISIGSTAAAGGGWRRSEQAPGLLVLASQAAVSGVDGAAKAAHAEFGEHRRALEVARAVRQQLPQSGSGG